MQHPISKWDVNGWKYVKWDVNIPLCLKLALICKWGVISHLHPICGLKTPQYTVYTGMHGVYTCIHRYFNAIHQYTLVYTGVHWYTQVYTVYLSNLDQ